MLLKALGAVVVAVLVVFVLRYAKGAFATGAPPPDSPGEEVFSGDRKAADRAVGDLADAGVSAWVEAADGGSWRVLVDAEQAPQVAHLLAVEQHLRQQAANASSEAG